MTVIILRKDAEALAEIIVDAWLMRRAEKDNMTIEKWLASMPLCCGVDVIHDFEKKFNIPCLPKEVGNAIIIYYRKLLDAAVTKSLIEVAKLI